MRTKSNYRRNRNCHSRQAGTALMEFLMALPFLFFILILTVNFGRVFLMRQRTIMAVRYVAFAEVHRQTLPADAEVSQLFARGEQFQVHSNEQGVPPDFTNTVQQIQDAPGLSGLMNSMSGTKGYQVQCTYYPVFAAGNYWGDEAGDWFPAITVSSDLVMDAKDWRHNEMSLWDAFKDTVGSIFKSLRW